VCSILEEHQKLKQSYQNSPDAAFPTRMLNYSPVPHPYFSIYNLQLCEGSSSSSHPKASSWTESEQNEEVIYRVTISESGAVFRTSSKRFTHFSTLEQFKSDIKAFIMVRSLTLFGRFRLVKSMQLWKREARAQVFNRHLSALAESLRWHSQNIISCLQFTRSSIFDVELKLEHITIWHVDANVPTTATPASQDDLSGNELQHCDSQIQASILCCKTWLKDINEDVASRVKSCSFDYLSTRQEPQAQFKLASTLDMVRSMRHEDLIKRLLPFVKVCSYMIESAKLQFCAALSHKISKYFQGIQIKAVN